MEWVPQIPVAITDEGPHGRRVQHAIVQLVRGPPYFDESSPGIRLISASPAALASHGDHDPCILSPEMLPSGLRFLADGYGYQVVIPEGVTLQFDSMMLKGPRREPDAASKSTEELTPAFVPAAWPSAFGPLDGENYWSWTVPYDVDERKEGDEWGEVPVPPWSTYSQNVADTAGVQTDSPAALTSDWGSPFPSHRLLEVATLRRLTEAEAAQLAAQDAAQAAQNADWSFYGDVVPGLQPMDWTIPSAHPWNISLWDLFGPDIPKARL